MANTKSAIKRNKQSKLQQQRNNAYKQDIKQAVKKIRKNEQKV